MWQRAARTANVMNCKPAFIEQMAREHEVGGREPVASGLRRAWVWARMREVKAGGACSLFPRQTNHIPTYPLSEGDLSTLLVRPYYPIEQATQCVLK